MVSTQVLWRRCLDACRDDVRGFVEGWFYDARLETLTRADVEAWIAGNVYGKEIKGDIDERRARQLAWMVARRAELFDPTSVCAGVRRTLRPCFENSTRAIDPSESRPNRRRRDRDRAFRSLGGRSSRLTG